MRLKINPRKPQDRLFWKGRNLWVPKRPEEAVSAWLDLDRRYGGAPEPELKRLAGIGAGEAGVTLVEMNRVREGHRLIRDSVEWWLPVETGERERSAVSALVVGATWILALSRLQRPLRRRVPLLERLEAARERRSTAEAHTAT